MMIMNKRPLKSLRLLAECYHLFERRSAEMTRALGVTPPQFDIIATLGNTEGMTFKELGEKTLITKGTLTGVIDRLEKLQLVSRCDHCSDKRSTIVRLTPQGEAFFAEAFPKMVRHCTQLFKPFQSSDFNELEQQLDKLKQTLLATENLNN